MADSARRRPTLLHGLLALPLLAALVEAARRVWVCDDVFISFRYIDHLMGGHGLVFNPGERVEGYTHFLWVMMLTVVHRLGLDLVTVGRYLPLLAFAALLVVLWRRSSSHASGAWLGLPIAAWCLGFHFDAQLYASSGLETSFFALLVLLGVLAVAGRQPRLELAAVIHAVAALVRPEGLLYTAIGAVFILWRWRSLRPVIDFAIIWLVLFVPFFAFRVAYYGDVLPNTFYAKSASGANWGQGWLYTRLYFTTYAVLLSVFVAIPLSWVWRILGKDSSEVARPDATESLEEDDARSVAPTDGRDDVALLAGLHVLSTVLYVTRLGGDFMFARFFIPTTPLMYLIVEEQLRHSRRRWLEIGSAALLVAATLYARVPHATTFVGRERVEGIANEANYYDRESHDVLKRQGQIMGAALAGTGARVGLLPGQDVVGYYGRFEYALEQYGLTDAEIAHRRLETRGRPGHEKGATFTDLLRRRVHFRLRSGWTVNLRMHRQIRFFDLYGEIVIYDSELMDKLRGRPGVNFLDFPEFLEGYMAELRTHSQKRLEDDYMGFQLFYFEHNPAPELFRRYRSALLAVGIPEATIAAIDERVAQFRSSSEEWQRARR